MLVPKLRFKEFKNEWNEITLKKILSFKNGINGDKDSYGYGIKYISVGDILNNTYITYDKIKGLVDINDKTLKENSVEYGDIVFQRSSETFNDIGQANVYLDKKQIATFGGFVIRGKKIGNYNPLFFNYLLKSPCNRKKIIVKGAGAQHYNISQEELEKIKVNFTVEKEQVKIANLFYSLDKKIELQQRKIEALKIYKTGLFNKIYKEKLNDIKESELREYAYLQGGYAFKSELFSKKGTPIIRIANINENIVDLKDVVFYDKEIPIDFKFEINTGDILIAMSGATTGKIGIYKEKMKSYLNQRVGKIVLKRKDMIYSYLYFLFELSSYNMQLNTKLVAGAQPNISPADIENLKFKIPSIKLQEHIANIAMNINKKLEIEGNKLQELNELKKGLLQKMFI